MTSTKWVAFCSLCSAVVWVLLSLRRFSDLGHEILPSPSSSLLQNSSEHRHHHPVLETPLVANFTNFTASNNHEKRNTNVTSNATATSARTTQQQQKKKKSSCWHVLWLVPMRWEEMYISDMLQAVPLCNNETHHVIRSNNNETLVESQKNHTIFITSTRLRPIVNNLNIMNQYTQQGFIYVTFLISEESEPQGKSCISDPEVSLINEKSAFVLRNYWTKECDNLEKVLVVPLYATANAYKFGFEEQCGDHFGKPPQNRTLLLSFSSGHHLRQRDTFVRAIQSSSTNMNTTDMISLQYGRGRAKPDYSGVLANSQYAGVVTGNVEETWRFTESLFCGAIPIFQQEVYEYLAVSVEVPP
eukprot:CAMPEP_0194229332 /NCGR_PEP_ID=MMETSP0156-20130528/43838_1 /TAXON_ID=33649 /ORGANISM="Thalassionema nitzschioides, Strain L26-B" /LENGTH=357 /DNA_ID=CAMNT_0038961881 /DNA_START=27 /DNA_END=1100 /DNA_ORIENTATION=-